jgi:hypothetical protein
MMVYGIGTISCEKLIQSVDTGVPGPELNLIVLSWAQGYVSAISGLIKPTNQQRYQPLDITGRDVTICGVVRQMVRNVQ